MAGSSVSIPLATEAVIWIACTIAAFASWKAGVDLGLAGLLLWLVFLGGVAYALVKFLEQII